MSLKRKSNEQGSFANGSNKKHRHEPSSSPATFSNVLPNPLPPLPPIDEKDLKTVLTHQSVVPLSETGKKNSSYTQLEFIGDAYIEVIASRLIWSRYDNLSPGRMSQLRESLVNNKSLGEIATKYGLVDRLQITPEVRASPAWEKIKGDVLEAYIAAMTLKDARFGDSGFQAAAEWLGALWTPRLPPIEKEKAPDRNSKGALSRAVVSSGVVLNYNAEKPPQAVAPGQNRFFIGVYITGWGYEYEWLGSGEGLNSKIAGDAAASAALENPLVAELSKMKKDFDEKTRQERASKEREGAKEEKEPPSGEKREDDDVKRKRALFMP